MSRYVFVTDTDRECLRNGVNQNTQNFNALPGQNNIYQETPAQYASRRTNNVQQQRGLHESFDFYNDCYMRSRNKGEPPFACFFLCVVSNDSVDLVICPLTAVWLLVWAMNMRVAFISECHEYRL